MDNVSEIMNIMCMKCVSALKDFYIAHKEGERIVIHK